MLLTLHFPLLFLRVLTQQLFRIQGSWLLLIHIGDDEAVFQPKRLAIQFLNGQARVILVEDDRIKGAQLPAVVSHEAIVQLAGGTYLCIGSLAIKQLHPGSTEEIVNYGWFRFKLQLELCFIPFSERNSLSG
ncbi:hypothetical protein [Hymenobacter arizonensis]|uniref:hypothetical protein n=1 Tax=Hymenobacter arizonensis TaxID=1227077 RepID=UPI001F1E1BAD|nr:hypothetical protein [Hymenobacter arizonensis]